MVIFLILLFIITALLLLIFNLPVFGGKILGERLNKIKQLPNYQKYQIENLSLTPAFAQGISYFTIVKKMIEGNKYAIPPKPLPNVKPNFNLSALLKITWFGHSTYLIQVDRLNILVDPVFSKRTSPFQFLGNKNFEGTGFITPKELPELDFIIITHDHYDHLDYHTILKLKEKTNHFITSLGVGAHLEKWGIDKGKIKELSWGQNYTPVANFHITATPAKHFSGRKFKRNQTLWSSFVLKIGHDNIFIGGDSGYDAHFKKIGAQFGPFDIAILECGQYNKMWPFIHMFPAQVVQATKDLNAKILLPVHWGKYKLALHNWDEPIEELTKIAVEKKLKIVTPKLGESFTLVDDLPQQQWWKNL